MHSLHSLIFLDSLLAPQRLGKCNGNIISILFSECISLSLSLLCLDLRRPRLEPSSYYSNECQRDLPLAKKHKPNPELVQAQLDKPMPVPLNMEQQTHKLSTSPKTLLSTPSSPHKSISEESLGTVGIPQSKMASYRGGHKWGTREVLRKGGISGVGKEKLASRLRQRGESLSMPGIVEREMVDTEILSYKEDLENQDCLSHMDDLQVREVHINKLTRCPKCHSLTVTSFTPVLIHLSVIDSANKHCYKHREAKGDIEHHLSCWHVKSVLESSGCGPALCPDLRHHIIHFCHWFATISRS